MQKTRSSAPARAARALAMTLVCLVAAAAGAEGLLRPILAQTGGDRTGSDRTGGDRTGEDRTGEDRTGEDRTGEDRTRIGQTGEDQERRPVWSDRTRGDPVREDALRAQSDDAIGLPDTQLGPDLWNGLSGPDLAALIEGLPAEPRSRVLRELARRALATGAIRPPGLDQSAFLAQRVSRLYAMAELRAAGRLYDAAPTAVRGASVEPAVSAMLLAGRTKPACAAVAAQARGALTPFLERATIVCHALEGRHPRARLGLTLMREQGEAPDAAFVAMVDAAAELGPPPDRLDRPDALLVALLAAGRYELPKIDLNEPGLPLLRGIVNSGKLPRAARIVAGERLALRNALPDGALAVLYAGADVPRAAIDSARTIQLADYGAAARLRLYQAAAVEDDLNKRMLTLAAWWRLATASGDEALTARLTAPLLTNVRPGRRWQDNAAHIARVYFWTGRLRRALDWYRVLRDAPFRNPDDLYRLTAVAALAGAAEEADLDAWLDHHRTSLGGPRADRKARRLAALLEGLGDPSASLSFWPRFDRGRDPVPLRDGAWREAARAAEQGRRGAALLQLIGAVGERELDRLPAPAFETAVATLRRIGLTREARLFAVEVALRTGL